MISKDLAVPAPRRRKRSGPDMTRIERVQIENDRLLEAARKNIRELRKEAGLD